MLHYIEAKRGERFSFILYTIEYTSGTIYIDKWIALMLGTLLSRFICAISDCEGYVH
jgi:hypothetical protein